MTDYRVSNLEKNIFSLSEGEILDRYSILDIKNSKINDPLRKLNVSKELADYNRFDGLKNKYHIFYQLLYFVNNEIWELQNNIKQLSIDNKNYSKLADSIFKYNQSRFRLKNTINILSDSIFKEQKSYNLTTISINIESESEDIFKTLIYSILNYDKIIVNIDSSISKRFSQRIKTLFPIISYNDSKCEISFNYDNFDNFDNLTLNNFIESNLTQILNPIFYIGQGKLGDFLLQLSVINENYIKTGKKGILYIYDGEYKFTFSIEKTFADLYDLVVQQPYIQYFKIWESDNFDINLSSWYKSNLLYTTSWHYIFKNEYDVDWGKNRWITTKKDNFYYDKIILTYNSSENLSNLNYLLYNYDIKQIILVGYSDNDKTEFRTRFGLDIPFIKCYTIEDMAIIINSCKLYIGTLSSPLVLAQATHQNTNAILDWGGDSTHNLLTDILPNYNVII